MLLWVAESFFIILVYHIMALFVCKLIRQAKIFVIIVLWVGGGGDGVKNPALLELIYISTIILKCFFYLVFLCLCLARPACIYVVTM